VLADFKNFLTVGLSSKFATRLCHISHRTLNVSLHYLVKSKRSTIAMLLMYLTQYHRFVSKIYNNCTRYSRLREYHFWDTVYKGGIVSVLY